jgi:hypothetical protein
MVDAILEVLDFHNLSAIVKDIQINNALTSQFNLFRVSNGCQRGSKEEDIV